MQGISKEFMNIGYFDVGEYVIDTTLHFEGEIGLVISNKKIKWLKGIYKFSDIPYYGAKKILEAEALARLI